MCFSLQLDGLFLHQTTLSHHTVTHQVFDKFFSEEDGQLLHLSPLAPVMSLDPLNKDRIYIRHAAGTSLPFRLFARR
jgi:hypothetical protein